MLQPLATHGQPVTGNFKQRQVRRHQMGHRFVFQRESVEPQATIQGVDHALPPASELHPFDGADQLQVTTPSVWAEPTGAALPRNM